MQGHFRTSSCELLGALWVNKLGSTFNFFLSETEGLALNTHGSHMVLTRLLGVNDPCLR